MSILNVDKIQPIGTGSTVTVNATDTILTNAQVGVITATSFSGSGANLTNLPVTAGLSTDAQENTKGGHSAGAALQSGAQNNTLIGKQAGTAISTGDRNTAIGEQALKVLSTGGENTAVGALAGFNVTGTDGVFVGQGAGYGAGAGFSGNNNIAIGKNTLVSATSAAGNTIIGWYAGNSMTTGGQSVAVGYDALRTVQTAGQNVAIGHNALRLATSTHNIAVGAFAGDAISSGEGNTALGRGALPNLQTGSNNIAIGRDAAASSTSVNNEVTIGDGNITKFRIPGINFELGDNGGAATNGHVLTMAAGGATWAAAAGGTTEGTWTPVAARGGTDITASYTTQRGTYTKVGKLVYVELELVIASVSGQPGSGDCWIKGLPFAPQYDWSGGGWVHIPNTWSYNVISHWMAFTESGNGVIKPKASIQRDEDILDWAWQAGKVVGNLTYRVA